MLKYRNYAGVKIFNVIQNRDVNKFKYKYKKNPNHNSFSFHYLAISFFCVTKSCTAHYPKLDFFLYTLIQTSMFLQP